jgi:putative DNA primase/helicase
MTPLDCRVQQQFATAMQRRGIIPPKQLIADGRIHRCNLKTRNGRGDGAYLLHVNGTVPAGWLCNWQTGESENWHFETGRPLSHAERQEIARKHADAAEARDEDREREQVRAAEKAVRLWKHARPCREDHPYLRRKQVYPHTVRELYDRVVVPVIIADVITSLQFISADGSKRFLTGGRVAGGSYTIGGHTSRTSRIVITEGFATGASINEATGATIVVAFNNGNLLAVAKALRQENPDAEIIIAADDDHQTKGNPGIRDATAAARAINAKLAVPDFGVNRRDRDTDFNDLATFIGPDAVKRCIENASAPEPLPQDMDAGAEIARLAALDPLAYEQERKTAAKKLGIRTETLDNEARKLRASSKQGALKHWSVEPWSDPVDGAELLKKLCAVFSRFVVLPKHGAVAVALWTLHAWTYDTGDISPYLELTSPEMRCGKTTVLIILSFITRRSELASNISPSAVYRYVEDQRPTLLIDEADTFMAANEELRGILNSGHTKASAYVIRNIEIGGEHHPRRFSTWCPKAFASIGDLANTVTDRSIVLKLQRKAPGQKVERLRRRDNAEFAEIRRKALRWAQDNLQALADADDKTQVPEALHDRAADNWRPLLAIADRAGGDWPTKAREAALALSGVESMDTASKGVRLLADIRSDFRPDETSMFTTTMIERLTADPERPWADYTRNGKPIGPKHIAALLKPFGIISGTVHVPSQPDAKGYQRAHFEEAWDRYLRPNSPPGLFPSFETSTRQSDCAAGASATFSKRPEDQVGRFQKPQEVAVPQRLGRVDVSDSQNGRGERFGQADARCSHCGQHGDFVEAYLAGEPLMLHPACIDPYLRRHRSL